MNIHTQILLSLLTVIVACSKSTTSRDSGTASPEREASAILTDSTQTQSAPSLLSTQTKTNNTTTVGAETVTMGIDPLPSVDTNAELDLLHLLESSISSVDTSTFTLTVPDFDFSKSFYLRTPTCVVTATSDSNGIYPKFHCEEGYTQGAWFYVDTGNGYITIQHPTQKDQRWRMYRSTGNCSTAYPPVFGFNLSSPPTGYASVMIPLLSNAVSYPLTFGRSSECDNGLTLSYYHLTPTSFTFTGSTSATLLGNAPLSTALAPTLIPSNRSPAQLFLPPCYLALTSTKVVVDCNAIANNSRSLFTYYQNPVDQKYYLQSNGIYLTASGTVTANATPTSLDPVPNALSSIRYVHVGSGYLTVGTWDGSSSTTPVSVGSTGFGFVGEEQ